jgi:hypothetical protein
MKKAKRKAGQPTRYKPDYCRDIVSFFEKAPKWQEINDSHSEGFQNNTRYKHVPAPMPTFFRYAEKIGVSDNTLDNWTKKNPEFFVAYNKCKELQKEWLIEIGLSGMTPPASFIFVAKNVTGMRDKTEVDLGNNGKPFEIKML